MQRVVLSSRLLSGRLAMLCVSMLLFFGSVDILLILFLSLTLFPGRAEENGFEVVPAERGGDRGRRGRGRGNSFFNAFHSHSHRQTIYSLHSTNRACFWDTLITSHNNSCVKPVLKTSHGTFCVFSGPGGRGRGRAAAGTRFAQVMG